MIKETYLHHSLTPSSFCSKMAVGGCHLHTADTSCWLIFSQVSQENGLVSPGEREWYS